MNKLLLTLLLLTAITTQAQLLIPAGSQSVKFTWLKDTLNDQPEPYSALLIPVKLPGCRKPFFMQFDLGAPHSLLYSTRIKAILAKYPGTDTTKFVIYKGKDKNAEVIGTIGEDIIDGKTLVIDYPKKRITISTGIPGKLTKQIEFSTFMLMKGSILLPAIIQNKQTILYFDTGSSAFELLASKATCEGLSIVNSPTESYPVKSWGRILTANTISTQDSLTIAGQKLPIKKATYIEGASDSQVQQMLKLGIGGMIGNKLFLNRILIIDTKNKKFGLVAKNK